MSGGGGRGRGRDFKEEIHIIVGAFGKSKICRVGWHARDPGKSCSSVQKQFAGRIPAPSGKVRFFVKNPTDWMRPTHIMKSSQCYPKATDSQVLKSTLTAMFDQLSGYRVAHPG